MKNALPPGVNHRAASESVTKQTDDVASSATSAQTAPLPAGTKAVATVGVPVKSFRSTAAK
jgi:hypothetical protein